MNAFDPNTTQKITQISKEIQLGSLKIAEKNNLFSQQKFYFLTSK